MSNSIAPFPYKMPYIDSIQPGYFSDVGYSCYWSGRALHPIVSDTHSAWPLLDIILTGIDQIANRDGWSAIFSAIARLEFVWDEDQSLRGVAIFDSRGQLVVHVVHRHKCSRRYSAPCGINDLTRSLFHAESTE